MDDSGMAATGPAPLNISISPNELAELTRCYRCDCMTGPMCTWQGEPCTECFDLSSYCHKNPDPREPGKHVREHVAELQPEVPIVDARIKIIPTKPTGDCLYECIVIALNALVLRNIAHTRITIDDLRSLVSRKQTEDSFHAYRALSHDQPEYLCLQQTKTLRAFQNIVRVCGRDVGAEHCLWGDENSIHVIANTYRLRIAVFNEKGKLAQFVKPESHTPARTIVLRLNRSSPGEEHFELMQFNRHTLLYESEWRWLCKRLGLI